MTIILKSKCKHFKNSTSGGGQIPFENLFYVICIKNSLHINVDIQIFYRMLIKLSVVDSYSGMVVSDDSNGMLSTIHLVLLATISLCSLLHFSHILGGVFEFEN